MEKIELRDHFAGQAMAVMLKRWHSELSHTARKDIRARWEALHGPGKEVTEYIALDAYEMADAMMAARQADFTSVQPKFKDGEAARVLAAKEPVHGVHGFSDLEAVIVSEAEWDEGSQAFAYRCSNREGEHWFLAEHEIEPIR